MNPPLSYQLKLEADRNVFRHYGAAIIANKLGLKEDDEEVKVLFAKMYDGFIEGESAPFLDRDSTVNLDHYNLQELTVSTTASPNMVPQIHLSKLFSSTRSKQIFQAVLGE